MSLQKGETNSNLSFTKRGYFDISHAFHLLIIACMLKNSLSIILIGILSVSCVNKDTTQFDSELQNRTFQKADFRDKISLKAELFVFDDLGLPVRITVSEEENKLFITSTGFDYWGRVFDLKTGRFLGEFSKKGQGPGELITGLDIQVLSDQGLVAMNGALNSRVDLFLLDEVNSNSKPLPVNSYNLKGLSVQQPKILNKDLLVDFKSSYKEGPKKRLKIVSSEGEVKHVFGDYPDEMALETDIKHISEVFKANLNLSNSRSFIGIAYAYTDVIEIYNSQKDLIVRLWGPDQFESTLLAANLGGGASSVSPTKNSRNAFGIPVLDDENLMVLYDGRSVLEEGYHQNEVLWFGIDGTPKYILSLDVPIFAFDVDWKNMIMYGLTHNVEKDDIEVAIVKYDLNEIE